MYYAATMRAPYGFAGSGFFGQVSGNAPYISAGATVAQTGIAIAALPSIGILSAATAGVAGAVIGVGVLIANLFNRHAAEKRAATAIVDEVEPLLKQNVAAYLASPRTQADYDYALNTALDTLRRVQQGCSNPALGDAGKRCISERLVEGGTAPWCPTGTGCDWIKLYVRPILDNPPVAVTSAAGAALSNLFGGSSAPGSSDWILIAAALALLAAGAFSNS